MIFAAIVIPLSNHENCPDAPGAPSMQAARAGCPGLVSVEGERLAVTGPLTFARGAAR